MHVIKRHSPAEILTADMRLSYAGSNAVIPKLGKMGFKQAAFAGAVTSGEVAHRALLARQGDFWANLGSRCIHLTWGARGQVTLAGLDLEVLPQLMAVCTSS